MADHAWLETIFSDIEQYARSNDLPDIETVASAGLTYATSYRRQHSRLELKLRNFEICRMPKGSQEKK